jgi:tetratricopeptide (TPR) repeat protein
MADDLVALALEDPTRAEARAGQLVASSSDPAERAMAHQALGILHRNRGQSDAALTELRSALGWARRAGDGERLNDVRATYGMTLAVAGRSRSGLRQLDLAVDAAPTPLTLMRRGLALFVTGRHHESYRDLQRALEGFRADGDLVWEARTLHNLGLLELTWGRAEDARDHTQLAADLLERGGLHLEALWAEQNLGEIAYVRGDLPGALAVFDRVEREYAAIGHHRPHRPPLGARPTSRRVWSLRRRPWWTPR